MVVGGKVGNVGSVPTFSVRAGHLGGRVAMQMRKRCHKLLTPLVTKVRTIISPEVYFRY